jgi:hypothetical protein
MFPTRRPLPTSVSRGGDWSAGPEGFEPEFGEPFLAGGLVVNVVDDVVLGAGHAEEVRELEDHQPDGRVLADLLGVYIFMLTYSRHPPAIDSGTPLGLQAPGLMTISASRKRLPWGRFDSAWIMSPFEERACSQREETVEIFIEADSEMLPEERRRFALLNIPRHLFSEATAATARRAANPVLHPQRGE